MKITKVPVRVSYEVLAASSRLAEAVKQIDACGEHRRRFAFQAPVTRWSGWLACSLGGGR